MKPRHGAISSSLLTLAGVLGLSAAGLSVVTGVTPCSLVSACTTSESAVMATTVADTDGATKASCDTDVTATTVASTSECSSAKSSCDSDIELVADTTAADCAAKSDCGTAAMTVAATSDCSSKADCGEAQVVAAANASDCSTKTDCAGNAAAMTVANGSDCASKTACATDATVVAAANASDCSTKADCAGEATAMTVAASDEACGGECAEGGATFLPVAAHAFNTECPYSGNASKADVVAEFRGMKVDFCCNGCKARFEKADDTARAALVANVVKPINDTCCDKPVDHASMAVVQGFPVAFCKSACGEMVMNAPAEKQIAFVASKIKPVNAECCGVPAAEAKMVAFHDGKAVALCSEKCDAFFDGASPEAKDAFIAKHVANNVEACADKACAEKCDKPGA